MQSFLYQIETKNSLIKYKYKEKLVQHLDAIKCYLITKIYYGITFALVYLKDIKQLNKEY